MGTQDRPIMTTLKRQIGYFCHLQMDEKHIGAILVTNQIGVPVEFKYTEPVTATKLHRILYGTSLERHVRETIIRDRLAGEVRSEPEFFIAPYDEKDFLATLAGRGITPILTHSWLGVLYLAQGDLEHAIRVLEQGLALCRASGNRNWLRAIVAGLGSAYALQGRLAEGRALLAEAISESLRTGGLRGQAYRIAWLSEVCRLAGRGEEAWQHACQALDLARQQKDRGNEALALYQLDAVQAHPDRLDAAPAAAARCANPPPRQAALIRPGTRRNAPL